MKVVRVINGTLEMYSFCPETTEEAKAIRSLININKWDVEEIDKRQIVDIDLDAVEDTIPAGYHIKVGTDENGNTIEVPVSDHGICKRCRSRKATQDYSGKAYWVCDECHDKLTRTFDKSR